MLAESPIWLCERSCLGVSTIDLAVSAPIYRAGTDFKVHSARLIPEDEDDCKSMGLRINQMSDPEAESQLIFELHDNFCLVEGNTSGSASMMSRFSTILR